MKTLLSFFIMTLSFSVFAGPYGNETSVAFPPAPRFGFSEPGPLGVNDPRSEAFGPSAIQPPNYSHEPNLPDGEASGLSNIHYASIATVAALWGSGTCSGPVNSKLLKLIQISCEGSLDESRASREQNGIACRYDPKSKTLLLSSDLHPGATYTLDSTGAISAVGSSSIATCDLLAAAYKNSPELCSLSAALLKDSPKMSPADQLDKISACTRWAPGPEHAKVFAPFRRCALAK